MSSGHIEAKRNMRVTFFHRKVLDGHYSVEAYFRDVREHLPSDVESRVAASTFESRGFLKRAYNVLEAAFRQGDVNHITGDVHFLSYLLDRPRTILTILDCGILHRKTGLEREVLRHLWYTLPVKRVAAITVISQATKDDLLRFVDCDPAMIHVVYVSISTQFEAKPKPFNRAKPRLLQLGTGPNKNIERTAEALTGLSCKLDIVGSLSASQRDILQRFNIDYTASSRLTDAEIRAKYAECDIVMYPSTWEGFGMPIVEGNTVGRAVITGNVSSMPEIAGEAACLVDPLSTASIRSGYQRVVGDEDYRHRLIERGFENAKRFSVGAIADQYYQLYRKVLAECDSRG